MDLYKINYNKLQNIKSTKMFILVIIIAITFLILIVKSNNIYIYNNFKTIGFYENKKLNVSSSYEYINVITKGDYLIFNDKKTKYKVESFKEYENYNNTVFQNIELEVDENFLENEVGVVEFYFDKKTLFDYILELFKS